jgi:hypothetical protein
VKLTPWEKKALIKFKSLVRTQGITFRSYVKHRNKLSRWTDHDTLRLLYTGDFTKEKFFKALNATSHYLSDYNPLTQGAIAILNSKTLYIGARDRQLRPVIVCTPNKIKFGKKSGMTPHDVKMAYLYLATVARRFMFYPGKVENVNFLVDASGMGMFTSMPVTHLPSPSDAQQNEARRAKNRDYFRVLPRKAVYHQRLLALFRGSQNYQR